MLERRSGQIGSQVAVEVAHKRIYNQDRPYYEIAADIFAVERSRQKVAAVLLQRYGVTVSPETAGKWVNRAIEQRKAGAA